MTRTAAQRRGPVASLARLAALVALAALIVAVGSTAASAMTAGGGGHTFGASISGGGFNPTKLTVLAGDTVTWTNTGGSHTVTSEDNAFGSGTLGFSDTFSHRFAASGTYRYYCSIHRYMTGEVDVADILLDRPPVAAAPGRPLSITGRAALSSGTQVTVQADAGDGFVSVTTATVAADGSFAATVTPRTTTSYRVTSGSMTSTPIRVPVVDHHLTLAATHRRRGVAVSVRVLPAAPGATVVLQYNLRERFGWWPIQRKRLDRSSRATFAVNPSHRVSTRVVLTLSDGWTQLAASKSLRLTP